MAFMLYQQVYNNDALRLKCFSQEIDLKVCALTNYASKTRGVELVLTMNKMLQDMAEQGVVRGMSTRVKRRNSISFESLYQAVW